MTKTIRRIAALAILCLVLFVVILSAGSVLTQRNDNSRTAFSTNVTFTLANVADGAHFGKVGKFLIDDEVYAQTLYAQNINMQVPGGAHNGTQNVVFIPTLSNSLYAFNADTFDGTTKVATVELWHVNFNVGGKIPYPCNIYACGNIGKPWGILGTPVIDGGKLYLMAQLYDGVNSISELHVVEIATGIQLATRQVVFSAGGVTYNPNNHLQRVGMVLAGNNVCAFYASIEDIPAWYGQGVCFDKNRFVQVGFRDFCPTAGQCGVWMGGSAPAVDAQGNIYIITGNGSFNAYTSQGGTDWGDCVLKLQSGTLAQLGAFCPSTDYSISATDLDFSAVGDMLLGDNALLTGGKNGMFYLLRTKETIVSAADKNGKFAPVTVPALGGYDPKEDSFLDPKDLTKTRRVPILQEFNPHYPAITGLGPYFDQYTWRHAGQVGAFWSAANKVFVAMTNNQINQYTWNGSSLTLSAQSTGQISSGSDASGSPSFSISANGANDGIIWLVDTNAGAISGAVTTGTLHAFNATTLAEIWNSEMNSGRDRLASYAKWVSPTVVESGPNSGVYVPTYGDGVTGEVDKYGIIP